MKQKTATDHNELAPEGGSFGTGLFLGVVGGAVGMFLFGTKRGQHVLEKVKEEFALHAEEATEALENNENIKKALPALEETKKQLDKAVGTWKSSFPKFQKKQ